MKNKRVNLCLALLCWSVPSCASEPLAFHSLPSGCKKLEEIRLKREIRDR